MPHASALLIIDMINPFDFDGAPALMRAALPAAKRIAALKARLKAAGAPTLYVNDNFTRWQSDFRQLVAICSQPDAYGAAIAALLAPEHNDYFVLKPRHSAFFATPLRLLLEQLAVRRLIVTGIAGDSCILATAVDAHMNGFELSVPQDCIASQTPARNKQAIAVMKSALHADVRSARSLRT
ncbi:cysteine hydrolase [Luteimonas sp. SX5]|uniref:Cysteine hydrolase n=1 Tax=Luteimonas galliterrae TaxID=2940486 RepID=A0ABT0MIR4_9GAMM|nr:isochorismatase family cysteine hydrolase [Luteimonas galliterrae]MCL1634772.1 cysteine hydrolase [Luteimonas galliterrae]